MAWVYIIGGICLSCAALFFSIYFMPALRVRRALKKTPVRALGDIADGEVGKVVGHVEALEELLSAPLSGRPCVYYRTVAQVYSTAGGRSGWRDIYREDHGVDFCIRDGSGHARIAIASAQVAPKHDYIRQGHFAKAPPDLEAFLAKRGKSWSSNGDTSELRYSEGIIEPGESLAALGTMRADAGRTELELVATSKQGLLLSDDPALHG